MRHLTPVLLALATLALALPSPAGAALRGNPFKDGPSWVDHEWNFALSAQDELRAAGRFTDAADLTVITQTTHGRYWPLRQGGAEMRQYLNRVRRQGAHGTVPLIATENLPSVGCARNPVKAGPRRYRAWVRSWTRGIGRHRAIVVAEVDGLATSRCLSGPLLGRRIGLIRYLVDHLRRLPHVSVYIDAGASDWSTAGHKAFSRHSLGTTARLLRMSGIRYVRGFALNMTHFDWTSANIRYGHRLSALVGGKPFIVNTSRNGLGPIKGGRRFGNIWCNPVGRALGPEPTTLTGDRKVDAFVWGGMPGTSNGRCGKERGSLRGPATVGAFWVPYALAFVRNARRSPDFPIYRAVVARQR